MLNLSGYKGNDVFPSLCFFRPAACLTVKYLFFFSGSLAASFDLGFLFWALLFKSAIGEILWTLPLK